MKAALFEIEEEVAIYSCVAIIIDNCQLSQNYVILLIVEVSNWKCCLFIPSGGEKKQGKKKRKTSLRDIAHINPIA